MNQPVNISSSNLPRKSETLTSHETRKNKDERPDPSAMNLSISFYKMASFRFQSYLKTKDSQKQVLPTGDWKYVTNLTMVPGEKVQGSHLPEYKHDRAQFWGLSRDELGTLLDFLENPSTRKSIQFDHQLQKTDPLKRLNIEYQSAEPGKDKSYDGVVFKYALFENHKINEEAKRYIKLTMGEVRSLRVYLEAALMLTVQDYFMPGR